MELLLTCMAASVKIVWFLSQVTMVAFFTSNFEFTLPCIPKLLRSVNERKLLFLHMRICLYLRLPFNVDFYQE